MVTTRMLMRSPRRTALVVAAAATLVLALPLAWYLASPLFLTQAVSENAPGALAQSRLAAGRFGVVDAIHKGEGAATLVRLPDGQTVLRLEDDFRVTNGPDLYVYLSGSAAPRTSAELHATGAFEVAQLKGNVGGQNYALPDDLDLSKFRSVVIYCRRFTTVFSTAELDS
jgi:Electron transfer DM13